MRVLVTGATTPLGGALTRALLDDPAIEHVFRQTHVAGNIE